ncbi:uncharacterized protein LOC117823130 [Notolabrus celidotus]|uniref:uncharacterized protein LOC117823130 n=1 Tax=Notolabrus celidotus TaxID=1203425 RepID=UPI00148F951B|nr:uncharacterized protein LOC117823130 [Notolabrus celidotus]
MRMGRQCCVPGCKSTFGLHSFPADVEIRRRWLRAVGLLDHAPVPRAGVCNRHFSRDCFSNLMEVDMGFTKVTKLKHDAVPDVALPVPTTGQKSRQQRLLPPPPRHIEPKPTREIGHQTDPVLNKHAFGQVDLKPNRRSKATQTRNLNRSVWCDTHTLMADPEASSVSSTPVRRPGCEVLMEDLSCQLHATDSTTNCTSSSDELSAQTTNKYLVHEGNLMELFKECPVCTQSCDVSKTVHGTLLHVEQRCAHCEYFQEWSSQPMVNNTPAGNLQLCPAVEFTGTSVIEICQVMEAVKIQGVSETMFHKHQKALLPHHQLSEEQKPG